MAGSFLKQKPYFLTCDAFYEKKKHAFYKKL